MYHVHASEKHCQELLVYLISEGSCSLLYRKLRFWVGFRSCPYFLCLVVIYLVAIELYLIFVERIFLFLNTLHGVLLLVPYQTIVN